MKSIAPILGLLCLAACTSPQQRCVEDATRDLQVLDRLIVETQQNISRGFAIEEEVVPRVGINYCFGSYGNTAGVSFCTSNSTSTRTTPVAINIEAEREKLADLQESREAAAARSAQALAQCEAQFGSPG